MSVTRLLGEEARVRACFIEDRERGLPASSPLGEADFVGDFFLRNAMFSSRSHPWLIKRNGNRSAQECLDDAMGDKWSLSKENNRQPLSYPMLIGASESTLRAVLSMNSARAAMCDVLQGALPPKMRGRAGTGHLMSVALEKLTSADQSAYRDLFLSLSDTTQIATGRDQEILDPISCFSSRTTRRQFPVVTIPGLQSVSWTYKQTKAKIVSKSAEEWFSWVNRTLSCHPLNRYSHEYEALSKLATDNPRKMLAQMSDSVRRWVGNLSFAAPYNSGAKGLRYFECPITGERESTKGKQIYPGLPCFYLVDPRREPPNPNWSKLSEVKNVRPHQPRNDRKWSLSVSAEFPAFGFYELLP